jgi:serine/threonine protein kinase
MNQLLKKGQIVKTESSDLECKVGDFLGGGTQGEVYESEIGHKSVALKWYFPNYLLLDKLLHKRLQMAIKIGPPSDRFLWPMELARDLKNGNFGYIMPLRDLRFKGLDDIMTRRAEPTFRAAATAGFELANSYLQLHAKGLCYSDISFGNVFLDPQTGQICICDNDNVHINGEKSGIGGTIGFMAPEIVRGEASPSIETDLFSLAVLLFYLLVMHHPLEGKKELDIKCFDYPAKIKLYGKEPIFIFDPTNDSNRPVKGYHNNAIVFWPVYPDFLKDLFIKAFTIGLQDAKNGRVRESEWRAAMIRLRDSIIYCNKCGAENFYQIDENGTAATKQAPCWSCKTTAKPPFRIQIERQTIMLNHDSRLYQHHVDGQRLYDFLSPVGEVVRSPKDPNTWGLKNLTTEKWVGSDPDGSVFDIEPNKSIKLIAERKVNFGKSEGILKT